MTGKELISANCTKVSKDTITVIQNLFWWSRGWWLMPLWHKRFLGRIVGSVRRWRYPLCRRSVFRLGIALFEAWDLNWGSNFLIPSSLSLGPFLSISFDHHEIFSLFSFLYFLGSQRRSFCVNIFRSSLSRGNGWVRRTGSTFRKSILTTFFQNGGDSMTGLN